MCDRPKIHVFLGAPSLSPASSGLALASEVGGVSEDAPPARWRHLELTWTDGCLQPATDKVGNQAKLSRVEAVEGNRKNTGCNASSEDEHPTEASRGREGQTSCSSSTPKINVCCNDHKPDEKFMSPDEESDPEKEEQCSASVHEYLDSCFPAGQPEPKKSGPEPEPCCCKHQPSPAICPPCTRTQYLTTWTLSQALILRGQNSTQSAGSPKKTPSKHAQTSPSVFCSTPELFSSGSPAAGASAEFFSQPCSTPRVEEGGVVLQATTDGVLCSQGAKSATALDSPAKCPKFKKARISEDARTELPLDGAPVGLRGPTTLLVHCCKSGVRYSVLVAVVYPCHLKEIKVKSGPSAGTLVPLASIIVTDQSGVEMKVVLWRRAAFWALTVLPGDILLITGLQVNEDRWQGETVLQSTFSSKLLSLGQLSASRPGSHCVDARMLSSLCGFLLKKRPLLASLPQRAPQDLNRLPYASLRSLRVNTLVHALLRVTHTHISSEWRSEADSRCRSAMQLSAVLTVEQPGGQQGAVLLWGAAVEWLPRFRRDTEAIWDFRTLLVREGLTCELPELHSTPWSSVKPLDAADRRAQDFLPPRYNQRTDSSLELDLDTLLSQKYSGDVELRVQVTAFCFQNAPLSYNAPQPVIDSSTPLDSILEVLSGDITYTGCGCCTAELDTDANGIYRPCYPCLPHTTVRRYYRPGVLTVNGQGTSQVSVQVPPVTLQKILNAPPDRLYRSSAQGSQVKHIQVAAERIQTLLSLPRKTFIITMQSRFLCDENSIPLNQDFTLLDLQFPHSLCS